MLNFQTICWEPTQRAGIQLVYTTMIVLAINPLTSYIYSPWYSKTEMYKGIKFIQIIYLAPHQDIIFQAILSILYVHLTIMHQILDLYVCLLPHKIGALQGIGSRRSVPVEGLGGQVLSAMPFV